MSWTAKITIVLVCILLCGVGILLAWTVRKKSEPGKTNLIPVKNREIARRVWIVT